MVSMPLLNHDAVREIVDRHGQDYPHAAVCVADGSVVEPPVTVFINALTRRGTPALDCKCRKVARPEYVGGSAEAQSRSVSAPREQI